MRLTGYSIKLEYMTKYSFGMAITGNQALEAKKKSFVNIGSKINEHKRGK